MAQLVEHPTLDFGSGHDPRVTGLSPTLGSALNMEPAWDSVSVSHPLPLSPAFSLSNEKIKDSLSLSIPPQSLFPTCTNNNNKEEPFCGCAWMAQSVKNPTLDFGSGHHLTVVRLSPSPGSTLSKEPP